MDTSYDYPIAHHGERRPTYHHHGERRSEIASSTVMVSAVRRPKANHEPQSKNFKSQHIPAILICLLTLFLLQACTDRELPQDLPSDSPANAEFHWFLYEGNDPVYENIQLQDDEYLNPVISGFYPDPSIIRVDEDYYMVHSSFSYYPGIPIFHSKDLVNWEQIGHVLDRPSQLDIEDLGISRGVFAPTINYHDGVYYVLSTLVDAGGNFLVTSEDPAGPWSELVWLPDVQGIDPSIFFDDDGRIYILNNGPAPGEPLYEGHRALWIQEYFPDTRTTGPDSVIVDGGVDITTEPIWIEAPHLKKINGQYYLIAAEGGTGPDHSQVVFKTNSPMGPYSPYDGNPILTQRHLDPDRQYPVGYTGHADFVETQNGEWWAVFLGVRPYEGDYFNTGRETFLLPVRWTGDGWPIILKGEETVPFVHKKPDLPSQTAPQVPASGNFSYMDEFNDDTLAHYWTFIRTPREKWYNLENGSLRIEARPVPISGFGQPSFIGRRQQHAYASASVSMTYMPRDSGDTAGLLAFQNDNHYFFLGITLDDAGETIVRIEKRSGESSEFIASAPLDGFGNSSAVYLKIEAKGPVYDFWYTTVENDWILLKENADGKILSTEVAGGFVGSFFGMYAFTDR